MRFLAIVALFGLFGNRVPAAEAGGPAAGLPDPYQAAVRNWAVLPDQRTWGSTAGIEIGPHNEIWAIDRCGVNSCETSNLPPIHMLDLATGKLSEPVAAGKAVNPSFLAIHPTGKFLYAVGEVGNFGKKKDADDE